jgi:hypothetical protein
LYAYDAVADPDGEQIGVVTVDERGVVEFRDWAVRRDLVISRTGIFVGAGAYDSLYTVRGKARDSIMGTRAIAFDTDATAVAVFNAKHADTVFELVVVAVGRGRPEPLSIEVTARIVAMWASPSLEEIAALDARGFVHRRRLDGTGIEHRGPRATSHGSFAGDAPVDTDRGSSVVDGAGSSDACFTPAGACVGIRDGRACVFDDDGEAHFVEGPTRLESIAPHPRGVLALDAEDRAHVLAIDDEVSS